MLAFEARNAAELLADRSFDVFAVEFHVSGDPKSRNETSDSLRNLIGQGSNLGSSSGERMLLALGHRDRKWLASESGISPQTISDYSKRGISSANAAVAIAAALGVTVDWLLAGKGEPPAYGSFDWMLEKAARRERKSSSAIEVPVFELEVAAGDGRSVLDEAPIGRWPLSADWVADHVGTEPNLIVVKVRGDSQQPILADGDWLIVDRSQARLGAGLAVVRVDDILKVKRIELRGRTIALTSANPTWQTEELDREADQHRFEVIGRAVAAFRTL